MLRNNYSKVQASLAVFLVSAFFHEVCSNFTVLWVGFLVLIKGGSRHKN